MVDVPDSGIVRVGSNGLPVVENKSRWLDKIQLKKLQGTPLDADDWSFFMQSFIDAKDSEIEDLAKSMVVEDLKLAYDLKDEIDPAVYWSLKQKDLHLVQNLLRTIKQGRRDDSATAKNNLSLFNRYVKQADKLGKGRTFLDDVPVVVNAPDVVDLSAKKEDVK